MTITLIPIIYAESGCTNASLRRHIEGFHGITLASVNVPLHRNRKGHFANGMKRKNLSEAETPRKQRKNGQCKTASTLYVVHFLLADIFSLHLVERWIVALTPNCSCLTERGIDAIHFLFPSISSEARSCQEAPGIRRRRHHQARGRFWRGRQWRKRRRIEKHSFD